MITPVHVGVQGRARLEVAGLYRCQAIKARIDALLCEMPQIKSAQASTLTGRILVVFDPQLSLSELVALIEQRLHAAGCKAPPSTAGRPRRRFAAAQVLNGFNLLLRSLPSALAPPPAFGMAAGIAPDSARQAQERLAWHLLPAAEILQHFTTLDGQGLSSEEACAMVKTPSRRPSAARTSPFSSASSTACPWVCSVFPLRFHWLPGAQRTRP